MFRVAKDYKKTERSFVLQHDQSDCGVACLKSVVQYYNGNIGLEKLRKLSGTTRQGTTLLGLYQAANAIGFTAQGNEADIQALIDHKQPVILHVLVDDRLQHYVLCYGYENGKFKIGDPAKGICYYSKEELAEIWKSKTCLTLSPTNKFIAHKTEQKSKIKWFVDLIKEDNKLLIVSSVLALLASILGLAMAMFSQKLIDNILPSKDFQRLITGIVLVAFLLLIRVIFSALRYYLLTHQTQDFNNRIISGFYSALLSLPKSFFDTRKIGELVSRLNDTENIQRVIQTVTNDFVVNLFVSIVSISFLYYYSWQVGVIATISLPFYFLLMYRFNSKIIKSQKEVMQSRAHNQSNYIATMNGIATIKNNNKQSLFKEQSEAIYGYYQKQVFELGKIKVRLSLLSGVFGVVFLLGILLYTSLSVYYDTMMLGELMAILGVAGSLLPSVASLALVAIPVNEAKVAFNRMYEFVSNEKENNGNVEVAEFQSIDLRSISFRFAGRSQLLKDVSLQIRQGEFVGIVGESGSGKSTLSQIIQNFYEPENGEVLINNKIALRNVKLDSWRDKIGVVEQNIQMFNASILENIILGDRKDPKEIEKFFKDYGFDTFISQFPQGYATMLGEEGINLSGGQKQVIALARVLYKKPQLLILDEYTSAMDRKTENFSFDLLKRIKKDVGIVFITHRLHTLPKIADRIYVIDNGKTEVHGSHHELLQTSNFYSDYWNEYHK